jgi:flavin-dependent dehydrogenase
MAGARPGGTREEPRAGNGARAVGDPEPVGDAASTCDPVTAQGIVKALCDGEAAADAIAAYLAGAGDAPLLAYQDGVFARFRDYLRLRRHLYERERRWPQAPFWQNRLAPGGSSVAADAVG